MVVGMLSPSITTLNLDNLASVLAPGSTTIVASRPGWGGRKLAAQLAASYALYHGHAHVISPELSDAQYRHQYLADERLPRLSITTGDALFGDTDELERVFRQYRSGLVLIDYFDLLGSSESEQPLPSLQREIMSQLVTVAREHSLTVVVCSTLNRSAEGSSEPSERDVRIGGRDCADGFVFTHPLGDQSRLAGVPRGSIGVSVHTAGGDRISTVWSAADGAARALHCA